MHGHIVERGNQRLHLGENVVCCMSVEIGLVIQVSVHKTFFKIIYVEL